ncbi:MAG: hypothetical protein OXK76_19295 [Gammaproteobacteria bacterium]|nr:hypothetical protein [Gammaproteobacteria bacterium]
MEFGNDRILLAENAWEELETWTLAGLDLPAAWRWSEVRAAVDVKERYFDKIARARVSMTRPVVAGSLLGKRRRAASTRSATSAERISTCLLSA